VRTHKCTFTRSIARFGSSPNTELCLRAYNIVLKGLQFSKWMFHEGVC